MQYLQRILVAVGLFLSAVLAQAQQLNPGDTEDGISPVIQKTAPSAKPLSVQQKVTLVSYDHGELSSLTPPVKKLIIREDPDPLLCADTNLRRAFLWVRLKMGPKDYEFGDSVFTVNAVVSIKGWADAAETGSPLFTKTCSLQILSNSAAIRPEQLCEKDFTSDYYSLDHLSITISSFGLTYTSTVAAYITDIKNNLRLEASYGESFDVSGLRTSLPTDQALSINALTDSVSTNPVTFTWDKVASCDNDTLPNYQFQLLRLFNRNEIKAQAKQERDIIDTVDWSRALTIETGSAATSLTLTLAEGQGYYVWRVRPIGNLYPGGIADDRNWGLWTTAPADRSTLAIEDVAKTNIIDADIRNSIFFYKQFDQTRNWIYSRTFTEGEEGTRISEKMTYATGLAQPVQTQTHLQSQNNIVVSQSVLDFSGRPALNSLPTPVSVDALGYREGFLKRNSGNVLYGATHFDRDYNFRDPNPLDSGAVHRYYSDINTDLTIPNAETYGFTRVLYYPDATGRVREQAGVGSAHRLVNTGTPHTTRYGYGQPSDMELIAMFGDEAPESHSVQMISTTDPNGVISLKYVSKDGQTLATCLVKQTGTIQTALNESQSFDTIVVDTVKSTSRADASASRKGKTVRLVEPSTIKLRYRVDPKTFWLECAEYCRTCDYVVRYRIYDLLDMSNPALDTSLVIPSEESCESPTVYEGSWTTATLDPGTYVVERTIQSHTNTPSGLSWIDLAASEVRSEVRDQFSPYLDSINYYLDSIDLRGLYRYLDSSGAVKSWRQKVGGDSVLMSYTITTECCRLEIPFRECPNEMLCPSPLPSFEGMLYDRWGSAHPYTGTDRSFGDDPSKYFRRGGDPLYPDYQTVGDKGLGAFDTLVAHMIADGYDCRKLYDAWVDLVMNFGTYATSDGSGDPDKAVEDFDLLDAFLSRTGLMLEGISSCPYGDCSSGGSPLSGYGTGYGEGYLDNAHKYFAYYMDWRDVWNPKWVYSQDCEKAYDVHNQLIVPSGTGVLWSQYLPQPSWGADSLDGDIAYKEWETFYQCLKIGRPMSERFEEKLPCTSGDYACVEELRAAQEGACSTACEARYPSFVTQVAAAYRRAGQTVEGDLYTPSGEPVDELTEFVPMTAVECKARMLVEYCREGCELTPIDSSGVIIRVGDSAQIAAMQRSMYWSFQVDIPEGGVCTDTLKTIVASPDPSRVWGQVVVKRMNDSLKAYRASGRDTNDAMEICEWARGVFIELTGDSCMWTCSTVPPASLPYLGECPSDSLPYLFTMDETIASEFVLDDCALFYRRYCIVDGDTVGTVYQGLCHDICTQACSDSVCFRWRDLEAPDTTVIFRPVTCAEQTVAALREVIAAQIDQCLTAAEGMLKLSYAKSCIDPTQSDDRMILEYSTALYHFTLYYYDRAGNLVQTIPPQGVRLSSRSRSVHPSHTMATAYSYNSLKQMMSKSTPDGGGVGYVYDDLGRLRFSQEENQANGRFPRTITAPSTMGMTYKPSVYSYLKYDNLSRVIESGEALADWSLVGVGSTGIPMPKIADMTYPVIGVRYKTATTYSAAATFPGYTNVAGKKQRFLRNRVSRTVTESGVQTVYSYDPHGNVEWMGSYIPGLGWNYVRYEYDLISSNVLKVYYDEEMGDQFTQRYRYDEDNRLLRVETSRDGRIWDRDAEYKYYAYGPLKRVMIGEDSLQGLDYVYTVHGWLKGINYPNLLAGADPGRDGGGSGRRYMLDVFGMVLTYYEGDYLRKAGSTHSVYNSNVAAGVYNPGPRRQTSLTSLYNGNIAGWALGTQPAPGVPPPYTTQTVGYLYTYDVLNRLLGSAFRYYSGGIWQVGLSTAKYDETFSYDANGNIQTLNRHGMLVGVSTRMDSLVYNYSYEVGGGAQRNELLSVDDLVATPAAWSTDIDDQPAPGAFPFPNNYGYDRAGNLIQDQSEGTRIKWNAGGKVEEVHKDLPGISTTIKFWYNAAGNRVKKQVINNLHLSDSLSEITYYVRDAGEQVVAIYRQTAHYGGVDTSCTPPPNNTGGGNDFDQDGIYNALPGPQSCDNCPSAVSMFNTREWNPWQEDYDGDGTGDLCDPCPFKLAPGCTGPAQPPMLPANPWSVLQTRLMELMIYGSELDGRVGLLRTDTLRDTIHVSPTVDIFTRLVDRKEYELKDHLGNVRVVISDLKKISGPTTSANFRVKEHAVNHYYAFGALQEGMSQQNGEYRYGFNGKEKDNEIAGKGNAIHFEFREFDPRLCRFKSIDLRDADYPWQSPYAYHRNNPVNGVDYLGLGDPIPPLLWDELQSRHLISGKFAGFPKDQNTIVMNLDWQSQSVIQTFYEQAVRMVRAMGKTEKNVMLPNGSVWNVNVNNGHFYPVSGNGIVNPTSAEYAALRAAYKGGTGEAFFANLAKNKTLTIYSSDMVKILQSIAQTEGVSAGTALKHIGGKLPSSWVGPAERAAATSRFGQSAKFVRWGAGTLLLAGGVGLDLWEVYHSEYAARTVTTKISAWSASAAGAAALGALVAGQAGPQMAVPEEAVTVPLAYAVGGLGGYILGEEVSTVIWDWIFTPVK